MNPLLKLIPELEEFLDSVTKPMIADLEFFIKRESSNPHLRMFSLIYSSDDFKTVIYSIGTKGETITDVVGLPIQNYEDLYAMENYDSFVPNSIEEKEDEIYEHYREIEGDIKMPEYWNYSGVYFDKKVEVFENWFIECWKIASTNTDSKNVAYLSAEGHSDGINLTTGEYITDDDIEALFII